LLAKSIEQLLLQLLQIVGNLKVGWPKEKISIGDGKATVKRGESGSHYIEPNKSCRVSSARRMPIKIFKCRFQKMAMARQVHAEGREIEWESERERKRERGSVFFACWQTLALNCILKEMRERLIWQVKVAWIIKDADRRHKVERERVKEKEKEKNFREGVGETYTGEEVCSSSL